MQKERTRQAILVAARTLLTNNERLTIPRAAELASVSEPTAYRYYSDVRRLLRDALTSPWQHFEDVIKELRGIPSVEARARYAAEAMTNTVLQNEANVRGLIAMSYAPDARGSQDNGGATRPAFRVSLVDAVLEPLGLDVDTARRLRLKLALLAIIGAEAVLALKDATECSNEDVASTLGWCAYSVATITTQAGNTPISGQSDSVSHASAASSKLSRAST